MCVCVYLTVKDRLTLFQIILKVLNLGNDKMLALKISKLSQKEILKLTLIHI